MLEIVCGGSPIHKTYLPIVSNDMVSVFLRFTFYYTIIYFFISRTCFELGDHTLRVPVTLHEKNRSRLCERLKKAMGYEKGSIVVLEGGEDKTRYSSDTGIVFRQVCLNMESRNSNLFSL